MQYTYTNVKIYKLMKFYSQFHAQLATKILNGIYCIATGTEKVIENIHAPILVICERPHALKVMDRARRPRTVGLLAKQC